MERRATLEEIVRVAEKIDITKFPDDLINKVAEAKNFYNNNWWSFKNGKRGKRKSI